MFKKKPNIKPLAPLRSSDRRRIANQIIKDFNLAIPAPTTQDGAAEGDKETTTNSSEVTLRNSLLPENCLSAKFTTTAGPDLATVTGTIYVGAHPSDDGGKGEQRPLWVKTGDEEMFPTAYTLWKNPTLLPLLHTHSPVLTKLQTGADLMIPGLIGPPFPDGAAKGRLVAIASSESPTVPLVVGVCEVNVSGLTKVVGEKGKAVRVVHWVGDEIFNYGGAGGKVPDSLEWSTGNDEVGEAAKELEDVSLEDKDGKAKGKAKDVEAADTGEEEIRELTTKEIDEAFRSATLFGFHQYFSTGEFSNLELPLTSSQFISTLVLPFLPPASHFPPHNLLQQSIHPSLVMKKTSYKNAAKFLKQLEKDLLIKTKTRGGGEIVVMDINWAHKDTKNFTPYKLPETPKEDKRSGSNGGVADTSNEGPMKVVELFRPNGKAMSIFSAVGARTKDFYSSAEVKSILQKYIEKEDLVNPQNKRLVKMNPQIASYLLDERLRDDADALRIGHAKRDFLGDKLVKSCSPYYIVLKTGESASDPGVKPKAGTPPKIQVLLETRQGKKSVTKVSGVEPFGVDPKAMAEELQKTCAGSASVAQLMGSSPKNPVMEITVQGPQRKAVEAYLEKRGVAGRFVNVVDKTGGKKK